MTGWARELQTDRVSGLTDTCPECKRPMTATGKLFLDHPPLSFWGVQYYCPRCHEFFTIHSPDKVALIDAIVNEKPGE